MSVSHVLHPDSEKVAQHVCAQSARGSAGDDYAETEIIRQAIGLSPTDMAMAVDELLRGGFLKALRALGDGGPRLVRGELDLFLAFDESVKGWNSVQDAVRVAEELVKRGGARCDALAVALAWDARRLNPACGYLVQGDFVMVSREVGAHPFAFTELRATQATHRFIRDSKKP